MMAFFKNHKILLTLDQMMYSGSTLLLNLSLAKLLSIHSFGIYASLVVASYLILSIVQSVIIQPAQVHLTKVKNVSNYKLFLLLLLSCSFIVIIAVGGMAYALPLALIHDFKSYIMMFVLYCLVFITFDFFRKYFLAEDKVIASFLIQSVYGISMLLGLILLYYFGISSLHIVFEVLCMMYILPLILAVFFYVKGITISQFCIEQSYWLAHFIDGQWLLYTSIIQWLSSNMYVLMSGMLISIEALGVLRLVQSIFGVFNLYLQMVENHLLPKMAKAFSNSSTSCYALFKSNYSRIMVMGLMMLFTVFVMAREVMVCIGGFAYERYAMILQGTCVLYAIILFGYGLRIMVRIAGMNKVYFLAYAISLVLSLLLYKNLFNNFGVMGAIVGLILNQLILQLTWITALIQKQYTVWRLYI